MRFAFCIPAVLAAAGCFPKANAANIKLRKEIQGLNEQIATLEARHKADQAQVAALEKNRTVETLPAAKLQKLFTASSLKFKNLVIGEDLDTTKPGDEGFKIGVTPVDAVGDEFKAAGSFTIELFDLSKPDTRLGTWSASTEEAQKLWLSTPVFDGYVFHFPWQTPPTSSKLLVKATFVEELTGRTFEATSELNIELPK